MGSAGRCGATRAGRHCSAPTPSSGAVGAAAPRPGGRGPGRWAGRRAGFGPSRPRQPAEAGRDVKTGSGRGAAQGKRGAEVGGGNLAGRFRPGTAPRGPPPGLPLRRCAGAAGLPLRPPPLPALLRAARPRALRAPRRSPRLPPLPDPPPPLLRAGRVLPRRGVSRYKYPGSDRAGRKGHGGGRGGAAPGGVPAGGAAGAARRTRPEPGLPPRPLPAPGVPRGAAG